MVGVISRRRTKGSAVSVLVAAALLLPLLPAHAATGVRTSRALEFAPSAAGRVLAWTQAPRSNPDSTRALLSRGDGSPIRLNARGTKGFTSGGAVDDAGGRVAYWERAGDKANIKFFNLQTRQRTTAGLVNTSRHEWGAAVSGHRLLFARGRFGGPMTVHLANLQTKRIRRLARVEAGDYLSPGDMSGRWATWTRCNGFSNCRIFRYNATSQRSTRLPNPRGRSQFAPSVLPNGTVFYGESANITRCDSLLHLFKDSMSASRRRFKTLAAGMSISATSVARVSSSRVAVYYDQTRCDRPVADIYREGVGG